MIETIYFEEEIKDHPRALNIFSKFKKARKISIHRYGELFNRRNQNFRIQKKNPSLILAAAQIPAYQSLIDRALKLSRERIGRSAPVESVVEEALDEIWHFRNPIIQVGSIGGYEPSQIM